MPINARRHIKKMRGGAQSHLIEGDDGCFYVVKFLNNPQHRRVLINELVCSVFLRYLQISCPDIALIEITPEFLRENPQATLELGSQSIAASPGRHFGSKFPGDFARWAKDCLLGQLWRFTIVAAFARIDYLTTVDRDR